MKKIQTLSDAINRYIWHCNTYQPGAFPHIKPSEARRLLGEKPLPGFGRQVCAGIDDRATVWVQNSSGNFHLFVHFKA